jgi:hypothetical protein
MMTQLFVRQGASGVQFGSRQTDYQSAPMVPYEAGELAADSFRGPSSPRHFLNTRSHCYESDDREPGPPGWGHPGSCCGQAPSSSCTGFDSWVRYQALGVTVGARPQAVDKRTTSPVTGRCRWIA